MVTELPRPPAGRRGAAAPAGAGPSPAAQLGRAVHRVLQWCAAEPNESDLRAMAAAAVTEFDLPASASETVATYARTIRQGPALQRFFDRAQFSWSADEFDVVSDGEVLRIDRLVRFGAQPRAIWWVLDYKLTLDPAADRDLRRQLACYRDAVQRLAGDAPVHAAFVSGDGALHELQGPIDD